VNGKEVIVQGEVAWRNEEACGGDFGVRFSEVDAESLAALRGVVGETTLDEPTEDDEPDAEPAKVQRGTRVRLHIDGLASPMKARVRDATTGELLVGSNLEFLKLGRPLELENIDADDKRGARIERVNIEVDPASRIPQLVVSLRYLDGPADELEAPAPAAAPKSQKRPDSTRVVAAEDREEAIDEDEDDEELARKAGRSEALWNRIKQVGPVVAQFGGKAKDVMSGAIGKAREWKDARANTVESRSPAPRRVTSPAPSGALRSGGRKGVVRDEAAADEPVAAKANLLAKVPKKPVAIGLAALVVLITVFAIAARKPSQASATAAAPEASASAAEAEGALPELAAATPPAAPGGPVVANVPLFGPTPMSTNEAVAMPTAAIAPAAAATPPPAADKLAEAAAAAGEAADDGSGDDASEPSDDDASEDKAASSAKASSKPAGPKTFARGKVRNPVVLSLRMTDNVRGLRGVSTATGFTVHVSGAQSKDPAAGLSKKDPRIASIKVSNKGDGADLTVQFKDGVPAYSVRSSGSNLTIALGRGDKADAKKTAKAPGKKKTRKGAKKH
ncbi:MAG TPA: hypothetical protein PLI95_10590, partial [Polyangiaceae bacterium]|nr:hypothetical protein [Polyangiaceae bacterium]